MGYVSVKWKIKAKERAKENNSLRKRLKEVIDSRDNFRVKYYDLKNENNELERTKKVGTKEFKKKANLKPKHHSFSTIIIQVILTITLRGGIKFRALEKVGKIRAEILGDCVEAPSHVTIRNWTLKIGYYALTCPKEKADDWLILLDHSIQTGQEKIFTVLGIREKDFLKLNRPLQRTDLEPLIINPGIKWNGTIVMNEILKLEKEIGKIKYAVGDYGSDLKKGLREAGIIHIHDLSHMVSLVIEKIYKNDERYNELKEKMSLMRSNFSQTNLACIIPPKKRKKSEYQSFDKLIKWAEDGLNLINNTLNDKTKIEDILKEFSNAPLDKIKEELSWINDYKDLITELSEINKVVKKIEKDMKYSGFSIKTLQNAKEILAELKSPNGKLLNNNLLIKLEEQFELSGDIEKVLFSSDILESIFGVYKNRASENPMASVTNLILIIAAFTCDLTEDYVKNSIENIKMSSLKKWSDKNVGISTQKQRNALLRA